MKRNLILILISFLIACALFYFVSDRVGAEEIWHAFFSFSPAGIFWILILTIIFILLGAWRWQLILKDRGDKFSLKDITSSLIAGFGISYFTPFAVLGGEAFRGYYLKKKFSFSWSKGIISIFIDKIFEMSVFFLIIILGILCFVFETLTLPSSVRIILLSLLFPIIILFIFYFKAFKKQSIVKLAERPIKKFTSKEMSDVILTHEKEIFNFFRSENKNMWYVVILSFARGIVNWIRSWMILYFLGMKVGGAVAFSVIAFTNLSYLFPLPAALGSHEALQAFSFFALGLTAEKAIAFTLVLRAFDILIAVIGIFIILRFSSKWIKDKITNQHPAAD